MTRKAERKIFAGHAVRRIRRAAGLTQLAMADALDISGSYLNLIERNQRPLTAALMLRLGERFDMDPRMLARIKRLARSRFLNYQSMIKQWLSERMEQEIRER